MLSLLARSGDDRGPRGVWFAAAAGRFMICGIAACEATLTLAVTAADRMGRGVEDAAAAVPFIFVSAPLVRD